MCSILQGTSLFNHTCTGFMILHEPGFHNEGPLSDISSLSLMLLMANLDNTK